MRIIENMRLMILICLVVISFFLNPTTRIARGSDAMEKDSSEEMLGICLNQEVTELIQKVFAKNGTIDAKELRNAEWRLKAIGVPTIPILLDYISLANSKDVTERIKGNMAIGMLVENR